MKTLSVEYYVEEAVYDLGGNLCGFTRWNPPFPYDDRDYYQDEFDDIQTLKQAMAYPNVDDYRVIKVVEYLLSYEDLNGESNEHRRD